MDIQKVIKGLNEWYLPKWQTLIAMLIAILLFFSTIDGFLEKFFSMKTRGIIYLLIILAWIIFWSFNRFIFPRNDKDKIGIVIAIYAENQSEQRRLKADFIKKLKEDLIKEKMVDFSNIIFLKNHFSSMLHYSNNPVHKLEEMNKKIRAHFYIWGDIKKRTNGTEAEEYFIKLSGYVIHKPVSKDLQKEISKEFAAALPGEINFLENRSFRGFEVSAKIVHLAARYIIGFAAFVSLDPQIAFKLHDGLKEKLNELEPLPLQLQNMKKRIPIFISDETLWIAKWHYNFDRIDEAKIFLSKSISENEKNYGAWLFKAILDFRIDSNPDQALDSLEKARKYSQGSYEWRYSEAFLHFWKQNYPKALKICHDIKNQSYVNEKITFDEVRNFNVSILSQDQSKPQLYFWIGYLSYFKDHNLSNALQDFEKFEELSTRDMELLKQKSSAYLQVIRKEMGLTRLN